MTNAIERKSNTLMCQILSAIVVMMTVIGACSDAFAQSGASAQSDQKLVPAKTGPDTLVICPKVFHEALRPWISHRQKQGHKIVLAIPPKDSYSIRQAIKRQAKKSPLKTVVLVGDSGDARQKRETLVPTDYVLAKVNRQFGSEDDIATDNTYADIDDDGIVDLSIGRMPVGSAQELSQLVERIIRYESDSSHGAWQRRINFVAGVGGFGQMIDKIIESTTKGIITDLVPAEYETSMTYGSWTSPYCPDPRRFAETSIRRFNDGCMFWVYIGHGSRHRLDKIYMPDQSHQILTTETCNKLAAREGNPIAIFLACYTGATDDPQDCLAEEMMRQPKGPIAIIAGTRVTMPYAMSLLSLEMLHEYFEGDVKTLGELVLVGKQRMANGSKNNPDYRNMIEGMGKAFSPKPELLEKERLEHMQLMHLIGDPLLRLKRPAKVKLESETQINSGETLTIKGSSVDSNGDPINGRMLIELAYDRDRFRIRPPRRKEYNSSDASFKEYQQTYENTHDLVCASKMLDVVNGQFEIELPVPADASGSCTIRAVLLSGKQVALGSSKTNIKKVRAQRTAAGSTDKKSK